MKKIITIALIFSVWMHINAQTTMNIHQSNGTVLQLPLNTIDSITYTINNQGSLAIISTLPVGSITSSSAVSGGNITYNGGSTVTERGVCWNTMPSPTTANNKIASGNGTGAFMTNIIGLNESTMYYVRAYAINSAGTSYGNELSFITSSSGGGGGDYTLIPDENFEQALIDLGHDDLIDGQVLTVNINGVDSLDVSGDFQNPGSISDLTGIEDFSSLTALFCKHNQLTSLDVSGCTLLTYLMCGYNQLTSLDVSQNTDLTFLNFGSNQLTSLDVSQNTDLSFLICDNNQLTSLDVSQNTALTFLNFGSNQLTSLDVSQNTDLSFLICDYNQLTSLDVSQNTTLNWFWCYHNELTILDVSNNTSLTNFNCGSNQLTSLDVSNNTSLTNFNCGSNQLTCLNLKNGNNTNLNSNSIVSSLYNPNLICIEVDEPNWAEQNWGTNNDQWTYSTDCNYPADCGGSSGGGGGGDYTLIPDENFEQALIDLGHDDVVDGQVLTSNISSLTSLYVYNDNISDLTGIEDFTALNNLNCSYNSINNLDVTNNIALINLNCEGNNLTSLDLSQNVNLDYLNAIANSLTSLDLSSCSALTDLDCRSNDLSCLNLKNGNNTNMFIDVRYNLDLDCIEVDDPAWATQNWTFFNYNIDGDVTFSTDCNYPVGCF